MQGHQNLEPYFAFALALASYRIRISGVQIVDKKDRVVSSGKMSTRSEINGDSFASLVVRAKIGTSWSFGKRNSAEIKRFGYNEMRGGR